MISQDFFKVKFIYFEKATKLCEIFTLLLTGTTKDKSKVKISQKFVAFSEYMNFTLCSSILHTEKKIRLYIFIGPIVCNEGKMRYIKAALSNSKSIKTSPWCVLYPKLGFPVVGNTALYAVRMNIKKKSKL